MASFRSVYGSLRHLLFAFRKRREPYFLFRRVNGDVSRRVFCLLSEGRASCGFGVPPFRYFRACLRGHDRRVDGRFGRCVMKKKLFAILLPVFIFALSFGSFAEGTRCRCDRLLDESGLCTKCGKVPSECVCDCWCGRSSRVIETGEGSCAVFSQNSPAQPCCFSSVRRISTKQARICRERTLRRRSVRRRTDAGHFS